MAFLATSSELFDQGHIAEAKRLAITIRILVHDTSSSHSLLGQLGIKDTLRYIDTSLEPDIPRAERVSDGSWRMSVRKDAGLAQIRMTAGTMYFWPSLEARPRRRLAAFDNWWTDAVLSDSQGREFSRRDLVLGLAHQDGGAHVDPELETAYAALSRSNSLGWNVHVGGELLSLESPVLANVRQIAFELRLTIAEQPFPSGMKSR
jgi:hypothetical protein